MIAPVKVLVVEDEWITSEEIKEVMIENGFDVIGQAADATMATELMIKNPADIVIMDINIDGNVDGIELSRSLMNDYHCAIIFLTAYYDDYFLKRAKAVNPAAYIVKPFQANGLTAATKMAFSNISTSIVDNDESDFQSYFVKDRIFVRDKHRFSKVYIDEILFIEAVGSYSDIFTNSGKRTLSINLKTFESRLNDPRFIRVHRSHLVNITAVDAIEGGALLIGQHHVKISPAYRDQLISKFKII